MTIKHLVFLTNADGDQARTAMLHIVGGTKAGALRIAESHGFVNFNVIERADSEFGYSDQRVATVRDGQAVSGLAAAIAAGAVCPDCGCTETESNGHTEYRCVECDHRWGREYGERYGY